MPANVSIDYAKKLKEYQDAKTINQRIRFLRELIPLAPKHKGGENLVMQLRKSLVKLISKETSIRKTKKGSSRKGIKKTAPLVVIIGPPNSGKTWLFNELTGEGKPKRFAFSTQVAQTAMGPYGDAMIQFIDCPSFDFSYANNADVVVFMDKDKAAEKKFKNRKKVYAKGKRPQEVLFAAWKAMKLIRVYTEGTDEPMLLKSGATMKDAVKDVHKTMIDGFAWAKVKRGKKNYRVGIDFKLKDGDIVWIKSRL